MIEKFVNNFMTRKNLLRNKFTRHPKDYGELVKWVIEVIGDDKLDFDKIHEIDDGNYEGMLVFIIPEKSLLPYHYWATSVSYGTCGGCDTLEEIRENGSLGENAELSEQQKDDYMALSLHLVQKLRSIASIY